MRFLVGTLLVGTITGIIPMLLVTLISKYTVISIIAGIIVLMVTTKELVEG